MEWKINDSDVRVLRDLAKRKSEIANEPVMEERRLRWQRHNDLQSGTPLVLIEHSGVSRDILPESSYKCREEWAKNLEHDLRMEIYKYERIKDDEVVDDFIRCSWDIGISDYGVEVKKERGIDSSGNDLGYHWEPPIKDLDTCFEILRQRSFTVNREGTLAWKERLEGVFSGIMPVVIRPSGWLTWTMGMTREMIFLVGLEQMMMYMYDNPSGVHKLMAFLRDDHLALAKWLEKEGLLTPNNGNEYIGSGSRGFTADLPQKDHDRNKPLRTKDIWVLCESQETVGVSPEMFEEFVAPYQREVARIFGLTYYGCCEPVHKRWESLKRFNNLRSVSISPWCDQKLMAEALAGEYVFSRKPSPTLISTDVFDEELILRDLRNTLELTRGCSVELIMKDVHNINGQPERLGRWVELARGAISEFY
jgi:hypothetical protein